MKVTIDTDKYIDEIGKELWRRVGDEPVSAAVKDILDSTIAEMHEKFDDADEESLVQNIMRRSAISGVDELWEVAKPLIDFVNMMDRVR